MKKGEWAESRRLALQTALAKELTMGIGNGQGDALVI